MFLNWLKLYMPATGGSVLSPSSNPGVSKPLSILWTLGTFDRMPQIRSFGHHAEGYSQYQTKACVTARSDRELGNDVGVENNIDVKDPLASICSSQRRLRSAIVAENANHSGQIRMPSKALRAGNTLAPSDSKLI